MVLMLALLFASDIGFTPPKAWKAEKPGSTMRVSQYRADGAEVIVFFFGENQGGTVEANIDRWMKQFEPQKGDPKFAIDKKLINGFQTTVFDITGTYNVPAFMSAEKIEPQKGWRMMHAIIETDEGNYFVRLLGPKANVARSEKDFRAFLETVKKTQPSK